MSALASITTMTIVLLTTVIGLGATVILTAVWQQNRPRCARCEQTKPKSKLMKFYSADMCEPCHNIASYYNQLQ